jgi:hypothetical protein
MTRKLLTVGCSLALILVLTLGMASVATAAGGGGGSRSGSESGNPCPAKNEALCQRLGGVIVGDTCVIKKTVTTDTEVGPQGQFTERETCVTTTTYTGQGGRAACLKEESSECTTACLNPQGHETNARFCRAPRRS